MEGGYAKVARLMVKHPEVATFQRFEYLNTLNILYLQAELVELEKGLKRSMMEDLVDPLRPAVQSIRSMVLPRHEEEIVPADQEDGLRSGALEMHELSYGADRSAPEAEMESLSSDGSSINERAEGARDWYYLSKSEHGETWQIMLRIREKLKEYDKAIRRQQDMKASHSPTPNDLKFLKGWFKSENMGNFPLKGTDEGVWEKATAKDLVAVKPRKGEDPLGSIFLSRVFLWWHYLVGYRFKKPVDEESQYFEYGDKSILRMANVLASIITSTLLVGSIVVLYFVHNPLARLGIIAGFTQMFSLILILATSARKAEVFAATAAFVAVMVVFVGSVANTTTG